MITTPIDYESLLYLIQDSNRQFKALTLPTDETIYNVDLSSRTVEAPEYLSVEHDHNAETVYFKVDRYFDNTDLARDDIYIIIQYNNADVEHPTKRGYIYAPPYMDITTFEDEGKILFPWVIEGPATAFAGTVTFSIRFYRLNSKGFYEYNLNTLPAQSKVLHGMNVTKETENYPLKESSEVEKIYEAIERIDRQNEMYWILME